MTYQSASTPIAVRAGLPPIEFSGQQEGEKILCIFHPHWLRRFVFIAKIVFVCLVFSFGSSYLAKIFVDAAFKLRISGLMGLIATVFYGSWWHNRLKTECRSYVTDRRVIRFEPMFPTFTSARGLFLSEIGKAKSFAPNLIFRYLKIGTIKVTPKMLQDIKNEDLQFPLIHGYSDISNYIDKLAYLHNNKPDELETVRPFVNKPRGERY